MSLDWLREAWPSIKGLSDSPDEQLSGLGSRQIVRY